MATLEENSELEEFSQITKVDAKKNLLISSCQSSPNKRKDSLGKIEKYYFCFILKYFLVNYSYFIFSSNLLYNLGESISSNKKILLKSDSKVYEKKESKNFKEDKSDPPVILKYIKNQVIQIILMC